MSDSEIIWKYLVRFIPDDHQAVYLYAIGRNRSIETAMSRILEATTPVFFPAMSETMIKATVKGYLEYKKKQYQNGEIVVKPIY